MSGTEGAANAAPEVISIADAAAECGVSAARMISWLVDSGTVLVIPGTEDPRCEWMVVDGVGYHAEDCECRFIASPHPDIQRVDR